MKKKVVINDQDLVELDDPVLMIATKLSQAGIPINVFKTAQTLHWCLRSGSITAYRKSGCDYTTYIWENGNKAISDEHVTELLEQEIKFL